MRLKKGQTILLLPEPIGQLIGVSLKVKDTKAIDYKFQTVLIRLSWYDMSFKAPISPGPPRYYALTKEFASDESAKILTFWPKPDKTYEVVIEFYPERKVL